MEHQELLTTDACTLPTAERPLRLAEFEALFADHLTDLSRVGDRLRLSLSGGDGLREQVADLAARESCLLLVLRLRAVGTADRSCSTWVSRAERREILEALAAWASCSGAVPAGRSRGTGIYCRGASASCAGHA